MRGTLVGWFAAVHVPKVAWQSVVDPAGSKVGLVVVVEVVVDEVVVDDDVCSIMSGVEVVVPRVDEGRIGGLRVLRDIVLLGIAT